MVTEIQLDSIQSAITDIRNGKVVIVVDDEDRENEGDFICAAQTITPEIINFMSTHGRGLICAPITENRAKELELAPMVSNNTSLHATAFTVSVDLVGQGCTTGISAYDRSTGIRALVDPATKADDFAKPGHIFPLIAKNGGVLRRTGHTEAAIDLARIAGFYPAGVLVEILNEDGSMARLPELVQIAEKHDLKIISIKDLIAFRMETERLVKKEEEYQFQSKWGDMRLITFRQINTQDLHFAIVKGEWSDTDPVLVRVHSSTMSLDLLRFALTPDEASIHQAMQIIGSADHGILLFMRHGEEKDLVIDHVKNILSNKQTSDGRNYGVGAQILRELDIRKIKLITDHPTRRVGIIGYGIEIIENIPLKK